MSDTEAHDAAGGSSPAPGAGPVGTPSEAQGPLPAKAKMSLADMLVGTTLSDRYRLDARIGEGAMGWVFRAEHLELRKSYAVKVLRPALSRMRDAVSRFRREARAAAQIGSKHIVDVSDFGTTPNGAAYMVMEYLTGGDDLATTLRKHGRLEWTRVVDIMRQCCEALQAAHDAQIVHRDVKPANLYRMPEHGTQDFIKVLDFGIARLVSSNDSIVTATGMIMGTPDFMAPEQAQGHHVDHRADIYSLGASAYAMLVGRPPFRGANEYDVIHKQIHEAPQPLRQAAPQAEIPDWLDHAILRAMSKEPEERFESMTAFAAALQPPPARADRSIASSGAAPDGAPKTGASGEQPDLPVAPWVLVVGFLALAGVGALLYVLVVM